MAPRSTPPTTPLGEAVEQAADGLSAWWNDVAALVQQDADRVATGQYGLARLASAGLRVLRVNVDNMLQMVEVLSDNIALLAEGPIPSSEAQRERPPPKREVVLMLTVPKDVTAEVTVTFLRGTSTTRTIPVSAMTVDPSSITGKGGARQVTITIETADVPTDIYEGTLRALENGAEVASVPFHVAIDELF